MKPNSPQMPATQQKPTIKLNTPKPEPLATVQAAPTPVGTDYQTVKIVSTRPSRLQS